jgi:hypothetical protein
VWHCEREPLRRSPNCLGDKCPRKDIVRCHFLDGNLFERVKARAAFWAKPQVTDVPAVAQFGFFRSD